MIEKMTDGQFARVRACLNENCTQGSGNGCDGTPLAHEFRAKSVCPFFQRGKCTKPEIVELKAKIKQEIVEAAYKKKRRKRNVEETT